MAAPAAPKMDPQMVEAKKRAVKEKDDKTETLVQAKDRGQFTATTAMSVVNIALLKAVLDRGPQNYKYYTLALALICSSLGLQIVAGVLSLFITNLKSYYEKYKDDAVKDMCAQICGCVCRSKQVKLTKLLHPATGPKATKLEAEATKLKEAEATRLKEAEAEEDDIDPGCCPWECTTRIRDEYEYEVLARHDTAVEILIENEVKTVSMTEEMAYLTKVVENAKAEKKRLKTLAEDPKADQDTINEKLREVSEKLAQAQKQTLEFEGKLKDGRIIKGQCEALKGYNDEFERNHVLKKVSFWQHAINYILYAVFVLNAFVTGLGIADGGQGAVPST